MRYVFTNEVRLVYNEKTKKLEPVKAQGLYRYLGLIPQVEMLLFLFEGAKYIVDHLNSTGRLTEDDSENIRKIIEEGRTQKVDEMEIEVSRNVANGLNLKGIESVNVILGSQGETKYVVKVKYKHDD